MTVNVDEMSGTLLAKLTLIANTIKEIEPENELISAILMDSFGLALRAIQTKADTQDSNVLNVDQQLEFVNKVLGYKLEDIVMYVVQKQYPAGDAVLLDPNNPQPSIVEKMAKEADKATLDFITSASDLDDYEKFLAKAKAQESIDFLKKQI